MATTLRVPQSKWDGRLTREYSISATGTIYFSTTKTLGITEGWFVLDPTNTNAELFYITGITGTIAEYSGTVSMRGIREYGTDTNVSGNQKPHRVSSRIIISDNHNWLQQIITAFNTHEDLVGAFHGFAGIGTTAARPAAAVGNTNKLYASTDDLVVYFSNGTVWTSISAGTQPDATTSVKGVTKLSVSPVSAALPIAVGDNDTRLTSAANMTDLTDGGDSTLHYHATDRARANHTGTQALSTIADTGTAGETLAANDLVYFKSSDSKYWKAVDGTNSWNATHVVYTGGAANATVTLLPLIGRLTLASNLTANTTYYRSSTGTLTSTRPSMSSSTIIPLLIGTTDAAGALVCKMQRLQRRVFSRYTGSTSSVATAVGFPISHVTAQGGYVSGTEYQLSNSGYYDVLSGVQDDNVGNGSTYILNILTSTATYSNWTASVDGSNNLVMTKGGASSAGVSIALQIFEAL